MRAYLDDVRSKPSDFDILWRNTLEARMYCMTKGVPQYISFDHDLGIGDSGYDFCKWLVEMDISNNSQFIPFDFDYDIHSANPVGAKNIDRYLHQYLDIAEKGFYK